jgi:hypothetical protein
MLRMRVCRVHIATQLLMGILTGRTSRQAVDEACMALEGNDLRLMVSMLAVAYGGGFLGMRPVGRVLYDDVAKAVRHWVQKHEPYVRFL